MKIINVTNNFPNLVNEQLRNTDALTVEVYSAGNTTTIFTRASTHYELIITNKHRAIRPDERESIQTFFLKKRIDQSIIDKNNISIIDEPRLLEISYPILKK
ncbi:MAG: DUF1827 family protein [Lactococcus sp.]|jgi:hypothetical protein|uniref:DUF1827 family protein n=3 Tax=Pseudolactococcus TaxID=3436058 RepID=A0A7L4WEJ2_9LACT|nr:MULTISPECIES: DUF1827 family protein [Lactococcus]SCA92558.1 conserved hypothetical protein [Lactococcus piscium]MBR6895861.1 DUF1827 family protein [Lactococcus sp.]MCJ1969439.1 DUF1827 family protein [Lactococcus carnosus]MCJ1970372.1 DUF1827 family protein [Lactococcus carnosus]MCJ1974017.1 DUF1827 family protein [Lactococcus carnosus]